MVYLFIFIAGILLDEIITPIISIMLEFIEAKKEVFMSNQSMVVAQNNSIIQKLQAEDEQAPVSAIGFECPSMDECKDDEYEEENHANMKRKVGFQ